MDLAQFQNTQSLSYSKLQITLEVFKLYSRQSLALEMCQTDSNTKSLVNNVGYFY